MSDRCERIREKIEESVGRAPGADEQAALEMHCAECESCREYRKKLLDDHSLMDRFAALHSTSERRFEEGVIEMLPAETPVRARRPGFRSTFARIPRSVRVATAVAAAILVVAGIDLLRGTHNGAVPAFASVIEKMEKAQNVIYRDRVWKLGKWMTKENGWDRSGTGRIEYADSAIIYNHRRPTDVTLHLYPGTKRADLRRWRWKTPSKRNPSLETSFVENLASWHKRMKFTFVRRERFEGKDTAVYEYERMTGKSGRTTIWIDLENELPLRIETSHGGSATSNTSYPYGLDISDFVPAGMPRSAIAGWTELGPGDPFLIWDNFRWNSQIDTSYFSLVPPPGYAVTIIDSVSDEQSWKRALANAMAVETPPGAHGIANALSLWVVLSGGAFPNDIDDLGDSSKVRPLLIAKHDKDGTPGDEFRAAFKDAKQLDDGFDAARHLEKDGNIHYLGHGATLGDSARIVCWGQETEEFLLRVMQPYWIIYADLRCVPSKTPPKIPKK